MGMWAELNDFTMFEGKIPCVRCKADSAKTLVGGHWKCSECAHVFNQDGSDIGVECYCETCQKSKAKEQKGTEKGVKAAIKKIESTVKKLSKKKKKAK
jgi:hypothetical protein